MRPLMTLVLVALAAASCGLSDGDSVESFTTPQEATSRCVLVLHGKGGDGARWSIDDAVARIAPRGNDAAWDGYQWDYLDDDNYEEARAIVVDAIAATECEQVVVNGFSNGAAMAAKLACDPSTGQLPIVGYVIDDPVTDAATVDCERAPGVDVVLYWTGALDDTAPPGADCGPIDWTCEGGSVRGIDAYAADLGVAWTPSIHDEHRWYRDAPEILDWLS